MAMVARVSLQIGSSAGTGPMAPLRALVNRVLGLHELDALYDTVPHGLDPGSFLAVARDRLGLDCELLGASLEQIPAEGPLVIVCNHPFGGADGLLLTELLLTHRGERFRLHLGTRIPSSRIDKLACEQSISNFLRALTLNLPARGQRSADRVAAAAPLSPLTEPVAAHLLHAEIDALGPEHRLLKNRSLHVYLARAAEIPWVLREIGRLRELTFRHVGEGTGRALDLDRFDEDYRHLFIWDSGAQRVVGAYRLGLVDELLALRGRSGLYTHSLFRYSDGLLQDIGPAVELGRSFIIPEISAASRLCCCCGGASGLSWRSIRTTAVCSGRSASAPTTDLNCGAAWCVTCVAMPTTAAWRNASDLAVPTEAGLCPVTTSLCGARSEACRISTCFPIC